MNEHLLLGLAAILLLGVGSEWLAWRLRLPTILLLLIAGFLAGPILGLIEPRVMFGLALFPLISISVGIVLFEGGLSLRLSELSQIGTAFRNMITVGVVVTWSLATLGAHFILGFDLPLALLLGAILIVTGPTVIIPLVRQIRPIGRAGAIARWEGIMNDPIGAAVAVLVFEAIVIGGIERAVGPVALGLLLTAVVGFAGAFLGTMLVVVTLRQYWVPDYLQNPFVLMVVVVVFALSNLVQPESGLLSTTLMGVALANQRVVAINHIIEFKENVRVLLILSLFILLASQIRIADLQLLGIETLAFIAFLMLVVRPLAVGLSCIGSGMTWREQAFLAWMAPRGIVAAAVTSVLATSLAGAGFPQATMLVPVMFAIIGVTVAIYGLTAMPVARLLGLSSVNPQGSLIVGAHPWARALAAALQEAGYKVVLVDTNWHHVSAARMEGLNAVHADILTQPVVDEIELGGIGRVLALASNDEVNALTCVHLSHVFGRANVYQLPPEATDRQSRPLHLRGRLLFSPAASFNTLQERIEAGAVIKRTRMSADFDMKAFKERYGASAVPLFVIRENGDLAVFAIDNQPTVRPGQSIIALVDPVEEDEAAPAAAPGAREVEA